MILLREFILVYRPLQAVFDFVGLPENDFQWQYGTLAAARISEGPNRVGMTFRSIGHLMGRRVESTFEVTEYEPTNRYGFRSLSGPLDSSASYAFEESRGATRIEASQLLKTDDLLRWNERTLEKELTKQLKENFLLLKTLLESKRMLTAAEIGPLTDKHNF